jgi:hypothetical protein
LWFGNAVAAEVAKALCRRCPVRRECAATALRLLDSGELLVGVWAGVSLASIYDQSGRAALAKVAGSLSAPG